MAHQRRPPGILEFADRVLDIQRRAHGPQRIVAVGDGRSEQRHHRIADMLVDGAAILGDHRIDARIEALDQPA